MLHSSPLDRHAALAHDPEFQVSIKYLHVASDIFLYEQSTSILLSLKLFSQTHSADEFCEKTSDDD